ncbi:hypothetical protein CTAYLR_001761 [Chrysophaeum taylorii]|uniref:Tyrosinase copper-binding domain-containing protein n=1 Tax=Chrysophaeum taylorii TaxID=2483200 RepID=A0AAD7UG90_9STRA|nr:hypothetical protein CTAYLR_001761 [Chrysophaeum taylorii]
MTELAKAAHSVYGAVVDEGSHRSTYGAVDKADELVARPAGVGTRVARVAKEARPAVGAALFRLTTYACLGLLGYAVAYARRKGAIELYSDRAALREGVQRYCEDGVCVIASNRYERDLGRPIANGLYEGIILELFQETRLEANDAESCEVSEELVVVDRGGCELDVMATRVGSYWLSATTATGMIVEFELVGKYVRREIRDLASDDRARFIDAIAVTHAVPDAVGRQKYGARYRSTDWFTTQHQFWSASRSCDHWHAGSGFLNMHASFTRRYEQTLQAIDERVVVAYWDFTIEDATRDCCFAESVLWSSDWFSTVEPNNSLNILDSGRFAFLPIRKSTRVEMQDRNAYGLLTVPWNTNPSPFLTRSQQVYGLANVVNVPHFGCAEFSGVMSSSRAYGLAMNSIASTLHSPVHGMIGGYWNYVPEIEAEQGSFNEHMYNVSSASNAITKMLWRMGIVECPKFCAPDTPAVDCTCNLSRPRLEKHYSGLSAWDILNTTGALSLYSAMAGATFDDSNHNSSIWDIVLRQVANGGHVGTATTDGSPTDPTFWLIHGMQERFLQQLRFLNDTGLWYFDQTWQVVTGNNFYYDWSNATRSEDIPYKNKSATCSGHRENDIIPFANILEDQPKPFLTNLEYYNMTKAFSPHLPYVYDQLLNWTQCGWAFGLDLEGSSNP